MLFLATLSASAAKADDFNAVPLAADDFNAVPLAAGEVAPFDGQLLTVELALRLGLQADKCEAMNKLALDFERRRNEIETQLAVDLRTSAERRCTFEKKALRRAMEDVEVSFYERPLFVAMVTSFVWVALLAGTASLVGSLAN